MKSMNERGIKVSNRINFSHDLREKKKSIKDIFNEFLENNNILFHYFDIDVEEKDGKVNVKIFVKRWNYETVVILESLFIIGLFLKVNYNFSFNVKCLKDRYCATLEDVIKRIKEELKNVEKLEDIEEIITRNFEELYKMFSVSYYIDVSKYL